MGSNGTRRPSLAGLLGGAAVTPGILLRILPSREAVFAAFKKNPEQMLLNLAGCPTLAASLFLRLGCWDTSYLQSATAATSGTGTFLIRSARLINSTSRHSDCSSRIRTLNDSGTPGSIAALALHDGLVNLRAAIHVVRLCGQQFLQDVSRAVCFESPHFHLTETLPAELRLAAQRLSRNQRVRPDGPRVNLVVHQVRKLEHVNVAHRHRLLELLACHAVVESRLAR